MMSVIGQTRCDRSPDDCSSLYGFEYDSSSECEGNGVTIKCRSPEAPPVKVSPAHQFKAAAYNVFERDFFITFDGQRERTCRIPRWFSLNWADLDVIAFQEVFMGGCFHNQATLRDILSHHGFIYHTATTDCSTCIRPGGIFIASKWPIMQEESFTYNAKVWDTWDIMAAKGVSYAKVNKTVDGETRFYHVMSTHLQAGGGAEGDQVRSEQFQEWANFTNSLEISKEEAVIFAGDFNTDVDEVFFTEALATLGAILPPKVGYYNYTSDAANNDMKDPDSGSSWIDHVVYSANHLQPKTAEVEIVAPQAEETFPICWCDECVNLRGYMYADSFLCAEVRHVKHLADHFPIIDNICS